MSSHAALLIWLLLGLVLTVAVGVDAHNRGRSGFLWGLLTFFTGIVGAFVYVLVLLSGDDSEDPESVRICPNCSATHSGTPEYCSDCGEALDRDDDAPTATVVRSGPRGYCSHCNTPVGLDAEACPGCGARL
jgi:hypothetical protein